MNICLVSQQYPPETARGGVGTQTWNKAQSLARLGHRVHVLACAAGQAPDLQVQQHGSISVYRLQPPGQELGREFAVYQPATYSLGYTWSVLRELRRLSRSISLDVIDFPEYGAEGFAYQLDRVPQDWVPTVVQLHAPLALLAAQLGWPDKESDLYQVGTFLEGVSIRHADGLMACSSNIADFTAEFYRVPREAISVVHCGVDADTFCPANNGRQRERPTVLFVGNIAPSKGVETLFDAVMSLRSKHRNIHLQILGSGDIGLVAKLQARAERAGGAANVQFCGFVQSALLPDFYREADVFCSPAQYEGGVANVFLEAMACGCPVVASTAGAAREAVVDGENGFLVPPADVPATAAALDRILAADQLRASLGQAGRRRVENYFAMDKYIQRVLSVYEEAIDRRANRLR